MDNPSLMQMAGPLGTVIVGLGGLGALLALAFAALSITRRRVPLMAWLAIPLLVIAAGAMTTWIQTGHVLVEAPAAGSRLSQVAASGLAQAWAADYLARQIAAALLVLSAAGAALGAVMTGKYIQWTPFAAVMTLLTALLGAGVLALYGTWNDVLGSALALTGFIVLGGVAVAIGALRRAYHEEAFRVAGLRFTSAVLYFLGVVQAARGQMLGARMDIFQAQATVAPDQLESLVTDQLAFLHAMGMLAWIAIATALLAAGWAFVIELGDVVQKYTVWDAFAATAMLSLVVGVRVVELSRVGTAEDIALLQPMPELIVELGYDLPTASVALNGAFIDAHFPRIGFGDALLYEDGTWVRKWAWTGRGWEPDDTPLVDARLFKGLDTLIAIPSGESAAPLVEVLEMLGGRAILLLRAGELELELPPEAAHLQGTLLPLQLSTERDLSKQLWADADKYDLYYGPIRLYGPGADEKDLVTKIAAAHEHLEGVDNLHVVVGERTRVANVAEMCVASEVVPGDEGLSLRGGWCGLATDSVYDFIAAGDQAVDLPTPEGVRIATKTRDYTAPYEAALARELPALAYCGERALEDLEEGQELRGNLAVVFTIDDRGRPGGYEWDEKNIDSRTLRTCVKARLDKVRFPVVEKVEEAAPPEGEAEEKEPGKLELTLTWR